MKTITKLISLALVLVMVLSMFTMVACTGGEVDDGKRGMECLVS